LQAYLQRQNMYVNPIVSIYTITSAILILIVLWLVNFFTIKKYIARTEK